MESLSNVVRVHLPGYLSNLPVPNSFTGWFSLGLKDWAKLVNLFLGFSLNQAWANPEKFSANPEYTDDYFWKTFTNIQIRIITFGKKMRTYKYG